MVYITSNVQTAINQGDVFVVFRENAQKGIDGGTKSCFFEIKVLETFAKSILRKKALSDEGWRVPEDCSVIVIDGITMSAYTVPTLTTLVQPAEELGGSSVQILLDMAEKRVGNRHIELETSLRAGGSVCKLN